MDNLFDLSDDDVDMPSRPASHMSSQSARSRTAPPTTDFDTDEESDGKEKANDSRQPKKRAETETLEGSKDIVLTRKRSAPKVRLLSAFSNCTYVELEPTAWTSSCTGFCS